MIALKVNVSNGNMCSNQACLILCIVSIGYVPDLKRSKYDSYYTTQSSNKCAENAWNIDYSHPNLCLKLIQGLDGRDGIPGEPGLDGVPGTYCNETTCD